MAEQFGLWAALSIFRSYGSYSDAGLLNGLARQIPSSRARAPEEIPSLIGHALVGTIAGNILFVFFALGARYWDAELVGIPWIPIFAILGFVTLEKLYKLLTAVLLGENQVRRVALSMIVVSVLDVLLAVAGAYWWGVTGLLIGATLGVLVTSLSIAYLYPFRWSFSFSTKISRELISASAILLGFGLFNVAIHNVDRTLFLSFEGVSATLGSYHAAAMLAMCVGIVPNILATVAGPTIYFLGSKSKDQLGVLIKRDTMVVVGFAISAAAFICLLAPYLAPMLFPKQEDMVRLVVPLAIAESAFGAAVLMDAATIASGKGARLLAAKWLLLGFGVLAFHIIWPSLDSLSPIDKARWMATSMMIVQLTSLVASVFFCFRTVLGGLLNLRALAILLLILFGGVFCFFIEANPRSWLLVLGGVVLIAFCVIGLLLQLKHSPAWSNERPKGDFV